MLQCPACIGLVKTESSATITMCPSRHWSDATRFLLSNAPPPPPHISRNGAIENRIIHGDNLEGLKALLPEFENRIDCIYIDPPYNTGNEGWVYNDAVNDPKIQRWLDRVVGKEGEDLSRHDKWLCMMYPRLKLLHRLLADEGSIWVSIDDNVVGHLRLLMDELFGPANFVASVVWQKADSPRNSARQFSTDHDYILVYSKQANWSPSRLPRTEAANSIYLNPDNDPRGAWIPGDPFANKPYSKGLYTITGPTGRQFSPPPGRYWRVSEDKLNHLNAEGRIWWGPTGDARPSIKRYLSEVSDLVPRTLWDKESVGSNRSSKNEIRAIFREQSSFDTPKPSTLIERILEIATDEDSIILDSFAGSGTTAHAVLKQNAKDGGNRRFILVEMNDYAETITAERVRRVMAGYGEDGKRVAGLGGEFSFYSVGEVGLFDEDGCLNPAVGLEPIRRYVAYTEGIPPDAVSAPDNGISSAFVGQHDGRALLFHYRRRLAQDFAGRIAVHDKDSLLQGVGLSPDSIREQLNVVVLSYDSLKSRTKDNRKLHEENGRLLEFTSFPGIELGDKLSPSAIDVIRATAPVVVVDESHNATSPLSRDMLADLGPSLVLDLTATPRKEANVISYVDAMALKTSGMVKLPVIVRNRPDKDSVYAEAIDLQRRLEREAQAEETRSGRYIRPIVLFQAESRTGQDSRETYSKVRRTLEQLSIAAAEIAIKTGDVDEIKGIDLLAKDCPIRFIITVNALKEGWDCPFAYVLASLADRTSPIEVEQILGRILRQPHARPLGAKLLNMSYVLTASAQFHKTIQSVVEGLKNAGFSQRDYRLVEQAEEDEPSPPANDLLTQPRPTPSVRDGSMDRWLEQAESEGESFTSQAEDIAAQDTEAPEVEAAMNRKSMRPSVKEAAKALHLPQFFLSIPPIGFLPEAETEVLLDRENLLGGFRLATCDATIGFEALDESIMEVDIEDAEGGSRPHVRTLDIRRERELVTFIQSLSHEAQIQQMTGRLYQLIGRMPPIADQDIRVYIRRILESLPPEALTDSIAHPQAYAKRIRDKIKALEIHYAAKEFERQQFSGTITVRPSYRLPATITPAATATPYDKRLYEDEWTTNGLEDRAAQALCGLDNLVFWHKNPERKGFRINGWFNHFPDFIVLLKSGMVVLLETKGGDRDNSDSQAKLELGRRWAELAGSSFRYAMVFDEKDVPGAQRLDTFIWMLKGM